MEEEFNSNTGSSADGINKNSSDDSEDEDDLLTAACMGATAYYYDTYLFKVPCHTRPFSGWANLMNMLNCENDRRCYENLRMEKHVFFMLCKLLVDNYGLRPMRSVTVEEQIATFLMAVGTREGNRQLQEFFQRSGFTISKSFHRVLKACTKMSMDWIRQFNDISVVHPHIRDNSKYFPYFKDCIGAMDGTHIKARLPTHEQVPFIGRKGFPTQNVLAICDFDLCFTYVVPGWEGSAHDTRVFNDALRDPEKKFPKPPPGKYYLVDAGYRNIQGFLAPYMGEKYHLPDFRRASVYNNHSEVFNHAHSSLRSAIERSFGVWKEKFQIMHNMPVNLKFEDQVALVPATMAIHNFIRRMHYEDEDFQKYASEAHDTTDDDPENGGAVRDHGPNSSPSEVSMDRVRDDICTTMMFTRIGVPIV